MEQIVLLNQTGITASGTGSVFNCPVVATDLVAQLVVSNVTGTSPTLTLKVQESLDGINFVDLATFTQVTASGTQIIKSANPGSTLRVSYTVGGTTPSFDVVVRALPKE